MILTHLWPWNKVQVIKPGMNCWTLSHVIITQFDRPPLNSVCKKANVKVSVKLENTSIISLEYAQKWKTMVYSLSIWLI